MNLRALNDDGIKCFDEFLAQMRNGDKPDTPFEILSDDSYTIELDREVNVERKAFKNKLELAMEVDSLFNQAGIDAPEKHPGVVAWLSLFHFDVICKKNRQGNSAIEKGKDYKLYYIPDLKAWNRYYRHKILGPYRIYKVHQEHIDEARALLHVSPDTHSEIMEQIASRQELITNRSIVSLLTDLYWDSVGNMLKRGHASKNIPGKKNGGGSVRRFAEILGQLDLTYDLQSIHVDELYQLLPSEFNRFKEH